jgi:hypothetical protein
MPRDGAIILSDPQAPFLHLVCEPCGQRGRYAVARLLAKHGDAKPCQLFEGDEFGEHLRSLQGAVRGDYSSPPFSSTKRIITSL